MDELIEAEILLDELFIGFEAMAGGQVTGRRFARDMARADSAAVARDQPEILYPAALSPRLRRTALFRKVEALAREIGGAVRYSFDHAIFKSAGNLSATDWHQDIALTRVGRLPGPLRPRRFHFWIPLQDVSRDNGCMEFIAGSHRGPVLPHKPLPRRQGEMGWETVPPAQGRRVAAPLAAGGLTIHDPRTLHYTGPNVTDHVRKAWIIHFSRLGGIELALKRALGRAPAPLSHDP